MLYKGIKNLLIGWSYGGHNAVIKNIQTTRIDRISLSFQLSDKQVRLADLYSDAIQYLSCTIAFLLPLLLYYYREKRKKDNVLPLSKSVRAVMNDWKIIFQSIVANLLFNAVIHLLSRRLRPYAVLDPNHQAVLFSYEYTSFYSGHTSTVAISLLACFFILKRKKASENSLTCLLCLTNVLVFTTGYLRILANKHFLTDVLVAIIFSYFLAYTIHCRVSSVPNPVQRIT